jgi:hypothetical protein
MNLLKLVQTLQTESGTGNMPISNVATATGEALRLVQWVITADLTLQAHAVDWKFLWTFPSAPITTGAGTSTYAGPSDLNVWKRDAFVIDGIQISEDNVMDYNAATFPRGAATGRPYSVYIMPNNQIRLFPTPNAAYDIEYEYYRKPVEMAQANGSQSVIPSPYDWVIVYEALSYYATFENAAESAAKAQQGMAAWFPKLEANQKPGHQYGTISDGNDLVVRAE